MKHDLDGVRGLPGQIAGHLDDVLLAYHVSTCTPRKTPPLWHSGQGGSGRS